MSILVGICTKEYCTFLADRRSVNINEKNEIESITDEGHKIFALSDRLIYGGAGFFPRGDDILTPLDNITHTDALSVYSAYHAVLGHLEEQRICYSLRDYMVGGIGNDGNCRMYKIHQDEKHPTPEVTPIIPTTGSKSMGMLYCTPPSLHEKLDTFEDMLKLVVSTGKPHDEMMQDVASVMKAMTAGDDFVGDDIECLTIYSH